VRTPLYDEHVKAGGSMVDFHGFELPVQFSGIKEEHMAEAVNILELLQTGNVGLIAETAAGKTIMSLLVILAEGYRTLFLTSRVGLTSQHQEMMEKITGSAKGSRIINGQVAMEKRDWSDSSDLVVFATPHVVMRELGKGNIDLQNFDLIIFDELHNATKNYPYVPVANIAKSINKPPKFLSLSASPGNSEEKIMEIENNLSIDHWYVADIKTPNSPSNLFMAEMTEPLKEIDSLFKKILHETAIKIRECDWKTVSEEIIEWSELEHIERKNEKQKGPPEYYRTLLLIAKYRKLHYTHSVVLTESYHTFLNYCFGKLEQDRSRSGMQIFSDRKFQKIISIAKENIDDHPKVSMFLEVLRGESMRGKNAIIFVFEKRTGDYLKKLLTENGFRAETIYGGIGKSKKDQADALEKLKSGKIDFLISTSVIEEGLNVSEVNAVIQYSLPRTGISRKQRGGRTGRLEKGHIIFISLNHPADRVSYWSKHFEVKKIEQLIAEKAGKKAEESISPKPEKRVSKKDELTLSLFQ